MICWSTIGCHSSQADVHLVEEKKKTSCRHTNSVLLQNWSNSSRAAAAGISSSTRSSMQHSGTEQIWHDAGDGGGGML